MLSSDVLLREQQNDPHVFRRCSMDLSLYVTSFSVFASSTRQTLVQGIVRAQVCVCVWCECDTIGVNKQLMSDYIVQVVSEPSIRMRKKNHLHFMHLDVESLRRRSVFRHSISVVCSCVRKEQIAEQVAVKSDNGQNIHDISKPHLAF